VSNDVEIIGLKKDVEYIKKSIDDLKTDFKAWRVDAERVARESHKAISLASDADIRSKKNEGEIDVIKLTLNTYDTSVKNLRYLIGTLGIGTLANILILIANQV
jgi:hypothetical protein